MTVDLSQKQMFTDVLHNNYSENFAKKTKKHLECMHKKITSKYALF